MYARGPFTWTQNNKSKFHYASWFGASSELAPNMFGASSGPAGVMEFGRHLLARASSLLASWMIGQISASNSSELASVMEFGFYKQ